VIVLENLISRCWFSRQVVGWLWSHRILMVVEDVRFILDRCRSLGCAREVDPDAVSAADPEGELVVRAGLAIIRPDQVQVSAVPRF
jgi:hypothetical protein